MQRLIFILLIVTAAGCSTKVTTSGTSNNNERGKYSEDLSVWRPKDAAIDTTKKKSLTGADGVKQTKYVEAKFASNQALDNVLDSISKINLANGHIDGFTIQIYS